MIVKENQFSGEKEDNKKVLKASKAPPIQKNYEEKTCRSPELFPRKK
jgi:hypothetical protein